MYLRGCLFSCLLFITLFHNIDSFIVQKVVRPMSSAGALQKGEGVTAKLLRLGAWVHMDNDVTEQKRRSFPGNRAPLDRLSGSAMATKQSNRQSKVVKAPWRRLSTPPIDRIGMSRLPNSRG